MTDHRKIAASIADELTEHPERWTQKTYARDANGNEVSQFDESACSFCLSQHMQMRGVELFDETYARFNRIAQSRGKTVGIPAFNDAPERTVQDIIALCRKVAASE